MGENTESPGGQKSKSLPWRIGRLFRGERGGKDTLPGGSNVPRVLGKAGGVPSKKKSNDVKIKFELGY